MKVLSIDAWGNKKEGYDWNNWYTVGNIDKADFEKLKTDKDFRLWFKHNGYTTNAIARHSIIEDDQYNIIICDAKTHCPLFAIEYGAEY